ncbi:MAG: hypothetical protein Q8K45_14290 [Rubrivivax sp.]|nr:hypothetical protein [Rubrivivax sp.]
MTLALVAVAAQVPAQTVPPKGADTPVLPASTLNLLHAHQVWRDELPDQVDPAALEVVFLSPDNRCRPPLQKGLFGMSLNPLNPVTVALCRRIESFVKTPPEPLPLAARVHTQSASERNPAAVLATMDPAPTRRYVALVHWDWVQGQRDNQWMFEVAVIDRSNGRWVWHGARAHEVWPTPDWQEKTELRALRSLLLHELPRDLLTRSWWREDVPVPGSRWVALDDIPAFKPAADRAGLAIVNSYYSSNRLQDVAALKLWPMGTPEIDDAQQLRQGDWSSASTVRRAQTSPLLARDTHALLDLPAGEYALRLYTSVEHLTLAPGQVAVLNIERGLGNAKTRSMETEAWWRETVLGKRVRHAFFAEPPSRGRPAVVPHFVATVP